MLAYSFVEFEIEPAKRGAVLELGLIVNVRTAEPIDLNSP